MIKIHALGWLGLLAMATVGCSPEPQAGSEASSNGAVASQETAESSLEIITVTIVNESGRHEFRSEVAATPAEQTRGLMFRESLADDAGMIFPMSPPRVASFWMRNTVIPLDMIFIAEGGVIANIARETEPLTLDSHVSDGPVIAVFEIAGGRAAELGIEAGDRVTWPGGPQFDQ